MAKIVKRKRRLRLEALAAIMMTLALFLQMVSSLFINTKNTSLTMQIQRMNNEIASLKSENQNLNIEIQTLQNKERVYVIAKSAGLSFHEDNVVSVQGE